MPWKLQISTRIIMIILFYIWGNQIFFIKILWEWKTSKLVMFKFGQAEHYSNVLEKTCKIKGMDFSLLIDSGGTK